LDPFIKYEQLKEIEEFMDAAVENIEIIKEDFSDMTKDDI
jgi:hypothetical protein